MNQPYEGLTGLHRCMSSECRLSRQSNEFFCIDELYIQYALDESDFDYCGELGRVYFTHCNLNIDDIMISIVSPLWYFYLVTASGNLIIMSPSAWRADSKSVDSSAFHQRPKRAPGLHAAGETMGRADGGDGGVMGYKGS